VLCSLTLTARNTSLFFLFSSLSLFDSLTPSSLHSSLSLCGLKICFVVRGGKNYERRLSELLKQCEEELIANEKEFNELKREWDRSWTANERKAKEREREREHRAEQYAQDRTTIQRETEALTRRAQFELQERIAKYGVFLIDIVVVEC
jgi:Skp family chaperone for outer membrane proteins